MRIIKPYFVIETNINGNDILKQIEKFGRTAYKSEFKITSNSAEKFVAMIIKKGHHSVIEHYSITVRIICDRGVSHELVRHRIASYTQESTRFCNYNEDMFGKQITFIMPCWLNIPEGIYTKKTIPKEGGPFCSYIEAMPWLKSLLTAEESYLELIQDTGSLSDYKWKPEQARSVLPNSLKTEIVVTMNLREWRHFFNLRTSSAAHPQMKEIAVPLLQEFKNLIPIIFDDIEVKL